VYRNWSAALTPTADPLPLVLPGRASRLRERCFTRIRDLASSLAAGLDEFLERPFALFGHSLGALVAFELAREMRRKRTPLPIHVFVSSRRGPRLRELGPDIHRLPDAAFVDEVQRRYDAIPEEVLREPELMDLLLPTLRADFEMLETYEYEPDEPLDCPITALGGLDDARVPPASLEAWRAETRGPFEMHRLPGGHFYLRKAEGELVAFVRRTLEGCTARRPERAAP